MPERSTRLALIVDCGFGDLVASDVSARRLAAGLAHHQFTITTLRGPDATRTAVRTWLAEQTSKLGHGDAFVFGFIGHGVKLRDPQYFTIDLAQPPAPSDLLLLISHDVLADRDAPEAGIPGVDLMTWLRPIAAATDNVTVFLDCCHATGLARSPTMDSTSRQAFEAAFVRVIAQLRDKYPRTRDSNPPPSPEQRIVRVVATMQNYRAHETRGPASEILKVGLFCDAVAASLTRPDAGDLTWDDHIEQIRTTVQSRCRVQRPGFEGPRERLPFTTRTRPLTDTAVCRRERGAYQILAGLLHGVAVGDVFRIEHADSAEPIGEARVLSVDIHTAMLDLPVIGDPTALRAVPIRRADPIPIAIDPGPHALADIDPTRLDRIGVTLVPIPPSNPGDLLTLTATVTRLQTRDADTIHVAGPRTTPPDDSTLLRALWRLAHLRRIERCVASLPPSTIEAALEWGLVDGPAFPDPHATLPEDSVLWVRVASVSRSELFVDAFHIRGDLTVHHLTAESDHGITIGTAVTELTRGPDGGLAPWTLPWPLSMPREAPVHERLMIVFSPKPGSLHNTASPTRGGQPSRGDEPTRVAAPTRGGTPTHAAITPLVKFLEIDLLPHTTSH